MSSPPTDPAKPLDGTFLRSAVLKSDVFSTIERGTWQAAGVEQPVIRRDLTTARWWASALARHFAWREIRSLDAASGIQGVPALIHAEPGIIIRGFIEGLPFQMARPHGQAALFADAKRLLREMRRARVCHNDLAKEPNWLMTPDGRAAVTDFQLASVHRGRTRLFRLLAHEDLRHLLKHKRTYCPQALTASERRVLAQRSLPSRLWRATGKRIYKWVTRGMLGVRDREGGGLRLHVEAPRLEAHLGAMAGVREAVIVGYPYRRRGVGLYAFVERAPTMPAGSPDLRARGLASAPPDGMAPPELLQIVASLPRRADGSVMRDVLSLIATNQIDLIDPLLRPYPDQASIVADIVAGRLNTTDRSLKPAATTDRVP